jgi:hypothetical protein
MRSAAYQHTIPSNITLLPANFSRCSYSLWPPARLLNHEYRTTAIGIPTAKIPNEGTVFILHPKIIWNNSKIFHLRYLNVPISRPCRMVFRYTLVPPYKSPVLPDSGLRPHEMPAARGRHQAQPVGGLIGLRFVHSFVCSFVRLFVCVVAFDQSFCQI